VIDFLSVVFVVTFAAGFIVIMTLWSKTGEE